MSYRTMRDMVSSAFDNSDRIRIEHTIEEHGASQLISAVYTPLEAEMRKFYRKPKLAEGTETKLAIIYGETMITPYILDQGTSTGTNDPENITRTVRFIAGDGESEGVVVGPNGSVLENVYMGTGDTDPKPVIDDSGRPSTKDILVASALGGIVQSVPAIWDAIFDDAPEDDKIGEVDPVTGEKIKSTKEREQEEKIKAQLELQELANVDKTVTPEEDFVLVFDNCRKEWTPMAFADILDNYIEITAGEDGTAGTVGTPGTSGTPATGGTPETVVPPTPIAEPVISPTYDPESPTIRSTLNNMEELVDISDLTNNQYFETRVLSQVDHIKLHFMFEGIGKWEIWESSNNSDPDSDFACLSKEQSNQVTTEEIFVGGEVEIGICLSVEICGEDYAFYEDRFTVTGTSTTDFTRATAKIPIADTLQQYINGYEQDAPATIKIRLRRMDGEETGAPKSIYPVHYQGIEIFFMDQSPDYVTKKGFENLYASVGKNDPFLKDDYLYPTIGPATSGLGPATCPSRAGYTIPATPPTPGTAPIDPVPGTPAIPSTPTTVTVLAKKVNPKLVLDKPFSTEYCEDLDGINPGFNYKQSGTVSIKEASSGTADPNVSITWKIVQGDGEFIYDTLPGTVSATLTNNNRTLGVSGPSSDMPAVADAIMIQASDESKGEIHYRVSLANDVGACAGAIFKVVPCSTEISASKSACAQITIETDTSDTGSIRVYSTVPNANSSENVVKKELTNGIVSKSNGQTRADYTTAVALAMQTNIDNKNTSFNPGDDEWLPAFTVTVVDLYTIKVCAPAAGGDTFNGLELTTEESGGVGLNLFESILDFFGGATRNIFNTPDSESGGTWDLVSGILLNVAGNIAGAAVTNMLFNDMANISITYPEEEDDVTVTFLYRGRKVKMPTNYDPATRTGAEDYDSWVGDWDLGTNTKLEWTDNPAWCLLDYIENRKFGMGDDLVFEPEQKETLLRDIFDIAQYCDEIADGAPRFSLNTAITDGTKIQILEQLCSVFFGSYTFYKGGLRIRADKLETTPNLLVNQTNAGDFIYQHTTLKSFVNKVEVTYVDPNSFYIERTVTAENTFGIDKYGEKLLQVFGFGITNKEQALRYANWILQSEQKNGLTVSYTGAWDHYRLVPGDIVQFEDSNERGYRLGGRVTSESGTTVTLDGITTSVAGDTFTATLDDGSIFETTIATANPDSLVLNDAPGSTILGGVFIITPQGNNKQLYRVVKVDEASDGIFNTTLQLYSTDKYNNITATTRS